MKSISLNITKAASFLAEGAVKAYEPKVKAAQEHPLLLHLLDDWSAAGLSAHEQALQAAGAF